MTTPTSPDPLAAATGLRVIADSVEHQRDRVASIAEPFLGTDRDDVVTMVHEAERQLLLAVRAINRAIKAIDS